MKKFICRLFALSRVIAATATLPVPSEAVTCTCTTEERRECRLACYDAGCQANFYCDWTTCVCQCVCP